MTGFDNWLDLTITCRVYRTLGSLIQDFFNDEFRVRFLDRLDRSHPYARWFHYAFTPDIRVEEDGTHTFQSAGHVKYRESRLHRTDYPGRCSMVARYSISKPSGYRPPPNQPPRIEYVDSFMMSGPSRLVLERAS